MTEIITEVGADADVKAPRPGAEEPRAALPRARAPARGAARADRAGKRELVRRARRGGRGMGLSGHAGPRRVHRAASRSPASGSSEEFEPVVAMLRDAGLIGARPRPRPTPVSSACATSCFAPTIGTRRCSSACGKSSDPAPARRGHAHAPDARRPAEEGLAPGGGSARGEAVAGVRVEQVELGARPPTARPPRRARPRWRRRGGRPPALRPPGTSSSRRRGPARRAALRLERLVLDREVGVLLGAHRLDQRRSSR